jgi:hypothetical protein
MQPQLSYSNTQLNVPFTGHIVLYRHTVKKEEVIIQATAITVNKRVPPLCHEKKKKEKKKKEQKKPVFPTHILTVQKNENKKVRARPKINNPSDHMKPHTLHPSHPTTDSFSSKPKAITKQVQRRLRSIQSIKSPSCLAVVTRQ